MVYFGTLSIVVSISTFDLVHQEKFFTWQRFSGKATEKLSSLPGG